MPHNYPYTKDDRLLALRLDNDFEISAGAVPPSGALGGAGRYKMWMDTSTPSPTLRIATAARAGVGYAATDWATMGQLDVTNRVFNYEGVWEGDFNVQAGASSIGNISMFGNYLYFDNATGTVNGPGGPFIFGNDGDFILHIGATSDGVIFQDSAGTNFFSVNSFGGLSLSGVLVAQVNIAGGLVQIYDYSGNPALYMSASTTHYRQAQHVFEDEAGAPLLQIVPAGTSMWNNIFLAAGAQYIYFNGGTGVINGAGGPFIYGNSGDIILHIGSSNDGVIFQDVNGGKFFSVDSGGVVGSNGVPVIATNRGASYVQVYDYASSASLYLGPAGNLYRQNSHSFQLKDSTLLAFLDTTGLLIQNGLTAHGAVVFTGGGTSLSLPNGDLNVAGVITATHSGTAISVPNGDLHCQNIVATNDITATGVFRRSPGGAGAGARIECFGGNWGFMTFGINTGSLTVSPDNGVSGLIFGPGTSFSDARLKDNIRDSEIDALEMLRQTPVRAFEWNDKARELMPWATSVECGLVAQEVEETIPIAVSTTDLAGGTKYISDQHLTPYFIRAIQQLADRLDAGGL